MTDEFVIAPRFCGPAATGNGGYVAGLVARYADGPAEVTLHRPPPLDTPLSVRRTDGGGIAVRDGDDLVASAVPVDGMPEVPEPVPVAVAREAGRRSRWRDDPEHHPYPGCFVCGSDRAPGDGLHIMVGPVDGRDVAADVWLPREAAPVVDGHVPPEFVWAALDCPGGLGAFGESDEGLPYVLGRFRVRLLRPVVADAPHVVVGWRQGMAGRKLPAGSALFTEDGEPVAVGTATWIRVRDTTG